MKKTVAAGRIAIVLLALVVVGLWVQRQRELAIRATCQNWLYSLDGALTGYCYPPKTNYPPSLSCLGSNDTSPSVLVCPGVWPALKDYPEPLSEMDEYTDYIYVAGLGPTSPLGIPLLICPPINHRGKGGNVLDSDHSLRWVPSPEIDKLIDWTYAHAESNGLRVVVSEALTARSKGKYRSSP